MKRKILAGAAITAVGLSFGVGTAGAHKLDAYCDGPTAVLNASLYQEADASIDGGPAVHFVGNYKVTLDGHTRHEITISNSSDNTGNGTKSTPVCVVDETTTTAQATTTTVAETTAPPTTLCDNVEGELPCDSESTTTLPPPDTEAPPTTDGCANVEGQPPCDATTTTAAPPNTVQICAIFPDVCHPTTSEPTVPGDTTPQDACLNINPATDIGRTAIHFVPCGPGVDLCLATPGGEFILGVNGYECVLPATAASSTTVSASLPVTGADTGNRLWIGLGVVVVGVALTLVARRRLA